MAADATMAAGTNGYDDFTVNGKPAVKIGTSSKGGDMSVTVGAGATSLTVYAAAWKGVSSLSLNITAPEGVTITPASISLAAEENFTGSEKAFTVADESAYKFAFVITGADAGATFTFTTSIAKRFLMWSATYETAGETPVEPAVLITFGDSAVDKGAWSNGAVIADKDSLVKLTLVDPDAKIAIDLNDANFGTTEEYVTLKSRLKTGGKSSSSKNYINVEVAKDGQLYIMARTGSNSATDRNVVITNGTDTIFNQLLLESNATEVSLDDATSMKIYPVYSASLNAGVTYRISYPVNGVNFYGFDFVPEEEPVVGPQNLGAKTIAEFLALKNTTDTCILTGVVSNIVNATYGNFDLTDESGKVYVYGLLTPAGESKKFADLNVAEKDTLTVLAIYNEFNGNPQAKNAIFVEVKKSTAPVVAPENLGAKTIAEFLTLKNTKDTCILTGVVANITNTTYGNFDLIDETDTVYIYGLLTPAGESQKFADLNVAEKDTLTVLAIYNEYNGKPQAKNAIFVEVKKYVEPVAEHTYTIAGSSDAAFGTAWDPTNAANDMTLAEGIYKWEKMDIALAAGTIQFKVCEDHAWNVAYPAENYELAIAEAGKYTITITFNPETKEVAANATKTADIVVLPNIVLHGNFSGNWADTDPFVAAQDSLTASLTLALTAGTFEFGFKFDGAWKANGANLTREANTANLSTGDGNMHITADVPGNYVFTYTYENQGVVVTYPEPIIVPDTIDVTMSSLTAPGSLIWDDEVATDGWWQIMGGNDTCAFSLSNGNEITTAAGTYTVADLAADYSYITIVKANDTIDVAFVEGSITVAVNEAGVVTVVGALLGNDGNVYKFNLTYVDPKAETTVNVTISNGSLIDDYAAYDLYGVYGYADDKTAYVQLGIWTENGFQGNFTEDDLDLRYIGSFVATQAGTIRIFSAAITVTPGNLEGEYSITADLLCYNNTLYKVTMTIGAAQGIDAVEAATKAIKSLQNGILTIEKAGKTYNVNGTLIR